MGSKNLIKTDKVLKVDPFDILSLYKYVKYHMQWESKEFTKRLLEYSSRKEKLRHEYSDRYERIGFFEMGDVLRGIYLYIPLNIVFLPTYMRIEVLEMYRDILQSKKSEVVDVNELSFFNAYKVVDDPDGRFGSVTLGIWIEYRKDIDNYGAKALYVTIEDKKLGKKPLDNNISITSVFHTLFREEDTFVKYLERMKKLHGKKYSEVKDIDDSDISWLEAVLTTTINLINALRTVEFDENSVEGWLLKPYSDTFKGFGCDFDEALLTASKVISAFLF